MKKTILGMVTTFAFAGLSFADTIEFTTAQGFVNGSINGQQGWVASSGNWNVDATAGTASISVDNMNMALVGQPVTLSVGETFTFTASYTALGTFSPDTTWSYLNRIGITTATDGSNQGYNNGANDPADQFAMFTTQINSNGSSRVYGDGWNGGFTATVPWVDGDEMEIDFSLTLGTSAANTTFVTDIRNVTQATSPAWNTSTETNGIGAALYTALTGSGAHAYIESAGLSGPNGVTGMQLNSVSSTAFTAIPEPSAFALLGIGTAGLVALRRRRS